MVSETFHIDVQRGMSPRVGLLAAALVAPAFWAPTSWTAAGAATFGPPMLDITQQCGTNARRNVTAMSECIVTESEARAEILQKWHKVPDANAERCIKLGRKNQKYPYTKIAECLSAGPAPAVPAAAPAKPAPPRAR